MCGGWVCDLDRRSPANSLLKMSVLLHNEDLLGLKEFLSENIPLACRVLGMLLNKLEKKLAVEVWVNRWPDVTSVVMKETAQRQAQIQTFSVFALDASSLKELLQNPSIVSWNQSSIMFEALPYDSLKLVEDLSEDHNYEIEIVRKDFQDLYYAEKDSLNVVDIPQEVSCEELSPEHAEFVVDSWKFDKNDYTISLHKSLIDKYPSVCLFDTKGELIAFEMSAHHGTMNKLFVKPQHRKRGLGAYVTSALAQKFLEVGRVPYVYIEQSNHPSIQLHRKLGFKKASDGPWIWTLCSPKG